MDSASAEYPLQCIRMWLRAKLNFSDIPLLKISSCLSDEDLYALVFFPCIWIAKVGVTGFVQYVQPRMVGQREKRQSKNKLSALCLKNNNKTKKTKARQKYGTHALTRFYEIQQKCELSCQFHIWFFSVIFITRSQSRNRVITVPARYGTLALGHSVHTCQDAFIKPLKQQY